MINTENRLRDEALRRDAADPLREWRARFCIPRAPDGGDAAYLCGNSLGLRPHGVDTAIQQELSDWEKYGVHGHFQAIAPWYSYHEQLEESTAAIVGAKRSEVVMMNSLTVNLHLMLVSFYRPRGKRTRILIDSPIFPSDLYAVQSHAALHGLDPADTVVRFGGPEAMDEGDVADYLRRNGEEVAVVLLAGVNFLTGQLLDIPRLTRLGHEAGCTVGFDLAHAAGNVPLALHDWDVDFAVWCTYKYLNSGPGAVGGCFVHERWGDDPNLPRLGGWWGNDPDTRFDMPDTFVPQRGAAGWQLSNAPVMNMVAARVSHQMFAQVGMAALRDKSLALTGFLWDALHSLPDCPFDVITPADPQRRGCQLSLRVKAGCPAETLLARLEEAGIVCDFRKPDVLRVAPVPFYNTFHDVWRFISGVSKL